MHFLQAITQSGNTIEISDSRGSCEAGQTANTKQADGRGTLSLTSTMCVLQRFLADEIVGISIV